MVISKKFRWVAVLFAASAGVAIGQNTGTSQNAGAGTPAQVIWAYGPTVSGLQFKATVDHTSYNAQEPVILHAVLSNVTDQPVTLLSPEYNTSARFNIAVKTDAGKDVPLTAYGASAYGKPDFTRVNPPAGIIPPPHIVPAHGEIAFLVPLSRVFDLSQDGEYNAFVKMLVPGEDGKGFAVLESAKVRFSVYSHNREMFLNPIGTNPRSE